MDDCIDSFKVGGCGCGCFPCGCRVVNNHIEPKPCTCDRDEQPVTNEPACRPVSDSKGACVPKQPDPFHLFSGQRCNVPGGTMTVRAPVYSLVVENPPDDVLRDENGAPVLVNGVAVRA